MHAYGFDVNLITHCNGLTLEDIRAQS
jgi:hypothetical protein